MDIRRSPSSYPSSVLDGKGRRRECVEKLGVYVARCIREQSRSDQIRPRDAPAFGERSRRPRRARGPPPSAAASRCRIWQRWRPGVATHNVELAFSNLATSEESFMYKLLLVLITCFVLGCTAPEPAPEAPADVAAPPADSITLASGLSYKVIEQGSGTERPGPDSDVTVHYTGWTTDGESFDSSVARGQPATFGVSQVIPGWTEGLQLMVVGETRRLWIPEDLAYEGQPGYPQGMLVFDVELLSIR